MWRSRCARLRTSAAHCSGQLQSSAPRSASSIYASTCIARVGEHLPLSFCHALTVTHTRLKGVLFCHAYEPAGCFASACLYSHMSVQVRPAASPVASSMPAQGGACGQCETHSCASMYACATCASAPNTCSVRRWHDRSPCFPCCRLTPYALLRHTCARVVKGHGCCTTHLQVEGSLGAPQRSSAGCMCESAPAGAGGSKSALPDKATRL